MNGDMGMYRIIGSSMHHGLQLTRSRTAAAAAAAATTATATTAAAAATATASTTCALVIASLGTVFLLCFRVSVRGEGSLIQQQQPTKVASTQHQGSHQGSVLIGVNIH